MPRKKKKNPVAAVQTAQKKQPKLWTVLKTIGSIIVGGLGVYVIIFPDAFSCNKKKERPLLEIRGAYLDRFMDGQPVTIAFTLANLGKAPAFIKSAKIAYYMNHEAWTVPPESIENAPDMVVNRTIAERDKIELNKDFITPLPIGNTAAFFGGRIFLYASGIITYKEEDEGNEKTFTFLIKILPDNGDKFITIYSK